MKKTGRRLKMLIWTMVWGGLLVYAALLIPDAAPPMPPAGEAVPFAWSQDEYWWHLEARFRNALEIDPAVLSDSIRTRLDYANFLLDTCEQSAIDPASPLLDRLETAVFELASLLAAGSDHLSEFLDLHSRLRTIIKEASRHWDMSSLAARDRLYRLLYGTRTAVEEVILQADPGSAPALLPGTDEPSATPSADIMGVTIHSGDILISRGGAPTSALIARGNDYPGNFSHVAFAHVDSAGTVSIVEAHIERGVAVATIEDYLRDTKLRILILRLRSDHPAVVADPMLPHRAATLALARARQEHIAYDFEMDFKDNTRLFCSEVVSEPYARMNIRLWMGLSNISSPGVRSWLAAFGVTHFETQEPSDLEYDPQLRVVAEWRNPETLYQDHLDNAVVDAMLEGAEAGEQLGYTWYALPLARILKAYSVLKNLWGGVGPIPEGMNATTALKNDLFSKRHSAIRRQLVRLAEDFRQEQGYRPPYWELVRLARRAKNEPAGR